MNILIIEDERPAIERLTKMINQLRPEWKIEGTLDSIKASVDWFENNQHPALVLMDIQIADGNSFEIFNLASIRCPVIFTTAYDQFAIDAFKVNSVDYLLKPIKKADLEKAFIKFETLTHSSAPGYQELARQALSNKITRVVVRYADIIKAVEVADIAYFYTEFKINYLVTKKIERYAIDFKLEEIENVVDQKKFFRINRQFIINIDAIAKMSVHTKSRVKITLTPACEIETIVSTERSPEFKEWLEGKSTV